MPARTHRFPLIITGLLLLLFFTLPAIQAAPPASVTLTYFRAENSAEGARLQWQTATELDTAGFRIKRGESSSGPFTELDGIGLVQAQGGPTSGANYEAIDDTLASGQSYWYQLVEIEFSGAEQLLQTVELVANGSPTATVEGIATSADGGDSGPGGGDATATPRTTPAATNTAPAGAATNTAIPPATQSAAGAATATPGPRPSATTMRAVGGIAEAAEPTANVEQPLILAQATDAYPGVAVTEEAQDDAYPGAAPDATTTPIIIETTVDEAEIEGYPGGVAPQATQFPPTGGVDNAVGASSSIGEGSSVAQAEPSAQSASISRVLLWVGFALALVIFIVGAIFAIMLSTRKQRHDL